MIRKFLRLFTVQSDIQQLKEIQQQLLDITTSQLDAARHLRKAMEAHLQQTSPAVSVPEGMYRPFFGKFAGHPLHFVELFQHDKPDAGFMLACDGSILPTLTLFPVVYTADYLHDLRFYMAEGEAINAALPTLAAAQVQDGVLWSTRVRCVVPVEAQRHNVIAFKEASE